MQRPAWMYIYRHRLYATIMQLDPYRLHENVVIKNVSSHRNKAIWLVHLHQSLLTSHHSTGWFKKLTPVVMYALISSNIDQFLNIFHCQNQENICNNAVTKDPTTPQLHHYTTLWNVNVLKATIENKTTSVTTHFKSASSNSKVDTNLNYNCMQDVTVTLDNNWDNKHIVSCR